MRKMKNSLFLLVVMIVSSIMLSGSEARAADVDLYKKISGEGNVRKEYSFKLECKCKLTIFMEYYANNEPDSPDNEDDDDFYDDYYDDYYEDIYEGLNIELYKEEDYEYDDDYEDTIFYKSMEKTEVCQKTLTLSPGRYYLDVDSDRPGTKFSVVLSGDLIPQLAAKSITLEEGQTQILEVKGTKKPIVWKSLDKSVASVSKKGVVKGKKAGKTTIEAKCEGYTLKCKVTVEKKPATYSSVSQKMKAFAKKKKNFTYRTIDVGKKCRLYIKNTDGVNKTKCKMGIYTETITYEPYIELIKKGKNSCQLRLKMNVGLTENSLGLILSDPQIKMSTSNRRLSFDMRETSSRGGYDYSRQSYKSTVKGYVILSTSDDANNYKLRKFEKMLGQNSLKMRIDSIGSIYPQNQISAKSRKLWKQLAEEYSLLLKEY